MTERGQLDSQSNVSLVNQVEGNTTIITIVPEGTLVGPPVKSQIAGEVSAIGPKEDDQQTITVKAEDGTTVDHVVEYSEHTIVNVSVGEPVPQGYILAGDLVCELDSAILVDEEKQQQILVTQSIAELEKADKNVEIQETQNASDLAAAELLRDLAKMDFENYEPGEYAQLKATLLGEIALAKDTEVQSRESYEFAKRVAKKGYKSQTELESARIKVAKSENDVKNFEGQLRVLEGFTYVREMKAREEAVNEAEREITRVKLAGDAALAQFVADLEARKLTHKLESDKLIEMRQQIAACRMIAPQTGEVVYASQESRRSEPVVIEEGASVRERQKIINLPDLTRMQVNAKIHESKINQIRTGLPVLVRVDAFANTVYPGIIDAVSSVPSPGSWPNMDLKQYEATVKLLGKDEEISKQLKPGMTASLEIIVDKRKQPVLQIPVQSVLSIGERYFAFVMGEDGPERRDLKIGDTNDTAIELLDGVAEGEEVVMNPRTNFVDEIAELEAQFGSDLAETPDVEVPDAPLGGAGPGAGPGGRRGGGGAGAGGGGRQGGGAGPGGGGRQGGGGGAGPGGGGQGGGGGGGNPAALLQRVDANGDGKISQDEAPSRMKENFSTLDKNGDGFLERSELPTGGGGGGGRGGGGGGNRAGAAE